MEVMTKNKNPERKALDRLTDALVDDLLCTPDDELLAEFRETGGDPDRNSASMRAIFERSVLASNKRRLVAARAGMASAAAVGRRAPMNPALPTDVARARERLRTLLARPGARQDFMLAARNENELSDDDVLGMINDLEELGVLPADDGDDR